MVIVPVKRQVEEDVDWKIVLTQKSLLPYNFDTGGKLWKVSARISKNLIQNINNKLLGHRWDIAEV
jgi:hypothetical protein